MQLNVVLNDVVCRNIRLQEQSVMMNTQQDFLKFEAVLKHCEKRVPEGSLGAAMEYGRMMDYFDGFNSLSQSGRLLADVLIAGT